MRVGVIGCGYWGSKHVRLLSSLPSVDLVVAVDEQLDRVTELHRQYPGLLPVATIDEALDFVDAAIIATPPRTHAPIAAKLLEAGKHVLVEKPFATTTEEADHLITLADERGLVLMAGHTFEYNTAVHYLRGLVQSGDLGRIYYIDTARLNLGLYQPDVNVVWDLAPHDISILNYVLDSEPTMVSAWGAKHAGSDFEDVAYIRLEYGHVGTAAQVHVSWLDPCKVRRVTVVGSQRMAVYNDLSANEAIRIYDKGVQRPAEPVGNAPISYRHGDISMPHINLTEPLGMEDAHFIDCITKGTPCLTDGRTGRAVVKVLEAAAESLATGRPVYLSTQIPAPAMHPIIVDRESTTTTAT